MLKQIIVALSLANVFILCAVNVYAGVLTIGNATTGPMPMGVPKEELQPFYNQIQTAVKNHDGKQLIALTSSDNYHGIPKEKIEQDFDHTFSPCWLQMVLREEYGYYEESGMLGNGAIWVSKELDDKSCTDTACPRRLKIISINALSDSYCSNEPAKTQ